MTDIIYEHPLNEKIRTYLRLEHLFKLLDMQMPLASEAQQQGFFSSLFALIEVLDRNDVRSDLLKDIERCEAALVQWAQHPSVSDSKLQTLLQQAVRLQADLLRSGRLAGNLKEDKFLAPLRQRFFMPGGTCYFDLPQLQYWCYLPEETRRNMVDEWLKQALLAQQAIVYVLTFVRGRGEFQELIAENGFYQNNTEHYELLRIRYQTDDEVYPTVSGNKHRYAVRFMQLCNEHGRSASDKALRFQLACC